MNSVDLHTLRRAFPSPDWPNFITLRQTQQASVLALKIESNIRWFQGHFPDQAVLAGIVQTHWAAELGKYLFSIPGKFKGLDNVKFQTVILPDEELELRLSYHLQRSVLSFLYQDSDRIFSEGRMVF